MIEIKGTDKVASITGDGSLADVMAVYSGITQAVAQLAYRDIGIKEMVDDLMTCAWNMVRSDVFGEERGDA